VRRFLAAFGFEVLRRNAALGPAFAGGDRNAVLDRVFTSMVEHIRSRANGSFLFVQIGAYDGVTNDPIHEFICEQGWHGILVEPQPGPFEALKRNYEGQEGLIFLNVAVAAQDGTVDFHIVLPQEGQPPWSQQVASLKKENVLKHGEGLPEYGILKGIDDLDGVLETVQVPALSFSTLLDRYEIKQLDLLQIDAEGYDAEILRQVNFDRILPLMVRYEHMHLSDEDRAGCIRLLQKRGYLIVTGLTETLGYRLDVQGLSG